MTWMISEGAKSLKIRLYRQSDFTMSKSLKTLRVSLNEEWLEGKGKPIDIAKDTPFNISNTGAEKKSG